MNSQISKKLKKDRLGVFIRLSDDQQKRLRNESLLLGWSIPSILRENYFNRLPLKLTFDKEGESKFLAEFRRIGNNINQLTRVANSGDFVSGSDLQPICEQLKLLYRYVMRIDGVHQNSSK